VKFLNKFFKRKTEDSDQAVTPLQRVMRDGSAPVSILPPESTKADDKGGLPRFKVTAIGRSASNFDRDKILSARMRLRNVFTPAQPVTDRRMFAGRLKVLSNLIETIEERLAHVVIFGERGIGKTSLLHILSDLAQESRYVVLRGTCGAGSRFDDMFRQLLQSVPLLYLNSVSPTDLEAEGGASIASKLPSGNFDARELSDLLSQITGTRILIILDEYDRLENEQFRQYTAELIKNLSDSAAPVQLIIAGVSSNLHELIGYIPSIRRNVVGIPMPRLTAPEVQSLVSIGENYAGVQFDTHVADLIYALSNGSPYLARLICHHSSNIALDDERTLITKADVENCLDRMAEEAEGRLEVSTAKRVRKLDITKNREVLGTIARVASTPNGWFSANDFAKNPAHSTHMDAAIKLLDTVLVKSGLIETDANGDDPQYRFIDEGLPNFLWMVVARSQFQNGKPERAKAKAS
jgi:AAA+ ATPase superfamily predicted ATPase